MQFGREQFIAWMKRMKLNRAQTAKLFGWHPSEVTMYANGDRTPTLDRTVKIQEVAGIPPAAWASTPVHKTTGKSGTRRRKRLDSPGVNEHVER